MIYFEKILSYLGVLTIPSLIWNIYQFRHKNKVSRAQAIKDLGLKDVEFGEMMERHEKERKDTLLKCEGRIVEREWGRSNTLTSHDNQMLDELNRKQKREMEKHFIERGHLADMAGEDNPFFLKETKLSKYWRLVKKLFSN